MGTIFCTVNENKTIGLATIPAETVARLRGMFFLFNQKSSSYIFSFSPGEGFTIDWNNPIQWGEHGKPPWLTVVADPSLGHLEITNDSHSEGNTSFQILNTSGLSVPVTIENSGGEEGDGGLIECLLKENESGLVQPLTAGVSVAGRDVAFGLAPNTPVTEEVRFDFQFTPAGSVTFNMPENLPCLVWGAPEHIVDVRVESTRIAFAALVENSPWKATFTINTNFGPIDPTIVGNPETGGPIR